MTDLTDESLIPESHIGYVMGRMADDYLVSIAMTKSSIYDSLTLLFLHSHALELAAKAAALRTISFEQVTRYGHNSKLLMNILAKSHFSISRAMPSTKAFQHYISVFPQTNNIPGITIQLPSDDELMEYELCFFIESAADIKYGFAKNRDQIGGIHLAYEYINPRFIELYRACRNIFRTEKLDENLTERIKVVQLNEKCKLDLEKLLL